MRTIDPMLSLAFSVQSNKGVYALLLGSGISRAAGIPTGWEIVLDLVRCLARLQGRQEDCEPNPAEWYHDSYGADPDYSQILNELGKTPEERNLILRRYFEPNDEEREEAKKTPTAAHKAIAELASKGYVRLILTTNFDRLLERAMEEKGLNPVVLSTPEAIDGSLPLIHTELCVIKMHGDYMDTRIRNTPAELAVYDPRVDSLLDRAIDEFGLIVCGWSAEYDPALRSAIERCKNRRFCTYWASNGEPSEAAEKLINLRQASIVPIQSADSFFGELAEKTFSLEETGAPHPLSVTAAVSSLKRYLPEDRHTIRLHDLVTGEMDRLRARLLSGDLFPLRGTTPDANSTLDRFERCEATSQIAQALLSVGCYHGKAHQSDLWVRCVERVAIRGGDSGIGLLPSLRNYPVLLLFYCGGVAAVAGGQYATLAALLSKGTVDTVNGTQPLVLRLNLWDYNLNNAAKALPGLDNDYTPLSNRIYHIVREPLREVLPDDTGYANSFDRFEYIVALCHADAHKMVGLDPVGPIGRFGWLRTPLGSPLAKSLAAEVEAQGVEWPPLAAGLFGSSLARARDAVAALDNVMARLNWQ